jgi:rod shape-determining protein MreD
MNAILDAVKIAVCVFVLAVLQVAATPQFTPFGGGPDLVVILVVALALWRGVEAAALAGFAGGLLLDAVLFEHLGMQSLVYVGCAWTVATYAHRRDAGPGMLDPPPPRPLPWLIAGAAFVQVGDALLHVLLGRGLGVDIILWRQMVPSILQTTIIALALLPLLRRLFRPATLLNRVHRVAPA